MLVAVLSFYARHLSISVSARAGGERLLYIFNLDLATKVNYTFCTSTYLQYDSTFIDPDGYYVSVQWLGLEEKKAKN